MDGWDSKGAVQRNDNSGICMLLSKLKNYMQKMLVSRYINNN